MPTPLHLWIDDERDPARFRNPFYRDIPWVWARTASEALEILRQGQVEVVSFDNDLGPGEMEGHQIFDNLEQWIEEGLVARIPSIHVHTANPIARRRMILGVQRLSTRDAVKAGIRLVYIDVDPGSGPYYDLLRKEATASVRLTRAEELPLLVPTLIQDVARAIV